MAKLELTKTTIQVEHVTIPSEKPFDSVRMRSRRPFPAWTTVFSFCSDTVRGARPARTRKRAASVDFRHSRPWRIAASRGTASECNSIRYRQSADSIPDDPPSALCRSVRSNQSVLERERERASRVRVRPSRQRVPAIQRCGGGFGCTGTRSEFARRTAEGRRLNGKR